MANVFREIPALRQSPFEPEGNDGERVQWNRKHWTDQDLLLLPRDRQVEENVRMLAGQQWGVWSRLLGKWVDITAILDDKERRWRQRPVFNRLLFWFMLTHARMTENPAVVVFQPSTGDRLDRMLAEVYDPVFKTLWQDTAMLEVLDQLFAWLIPGGRAHLKTRVDPNLGDVIEAKAPAELTLEPGDGAEPITRMLPEVPFAPNEEGTFVPQLAPNAEGTDWEITGKAFREHEGGLDVTALSPLEVRGQWGSQIPWHRKRWHMHRTYLTPEEVWDAFGVEMEAEITGDEAGRIGELRRLLLGTGFFGAMEQEVWSIGSHDREAAKEFIEIYEGWYAPSSFPGMEESDEGPGGRLLITTRTKCLRDGQRPAAFSYTSPIRSFDFVNLPGRPSGTSPQEALNPIQRTYNRGWAQILEHRNLSTNPSMLVDPRTGLNDGDFGNEPGQIIFAAVPIDARQPVIQYLKPPSLGEDVYRVQDMARSELQDLGQIEGAEGRPPTRDPSGELVKELRFNSDRFLGPTMRRAVVEIGRLAEDWLAILPTIWDRDKVLSWPGEDQVVRTIVVQPHMFERGKVNVVPDVESMLPEGRGERQVRIYRLWQDGAFGAPDSPGAIRHYLEQARFPHLDAAVRPGGVHRQTAEGENGHLAQGKQPPVLEWYEDTVHLEVHESFMSSPEYLRLPIEIQELFVQHRAQHQAAMIAKFQQNLMRGATAQADANRAATAVAAVAPSPEQLAGIIQGPASGAGHLPQSAEAVQRAPSGRDVRPRREA